jgi:hypothetical protein
MAPLCSELLLRFQSTFFDFSAVDQATGGERYFNADDANLKGNCRGFEMGNARSGAPHVPICGIAVSICGICVPILNGIVAPFTDRN